ncbi:CRISPR-associated protein, Cas1 family [Pseudomonas pohangensis]|uniref:CRISPR-associated endonuclease Cas1 n=1 Tax=Pseudomonas pohangensis TaxID=364197 RepID=A0A1H2G163_9PSED|nr:CRISPR-associated endonuclease Cas1 [Pseudomonas pohangensis]SDU13240.1 CRISPR-associated protein, Cas1 family [Pseudomonas pohangensis]
MSTLILDHRDLSLDYENHCLLVRHPDQPPRSVPLASLERILCMHSVQLTSRLLGHCQQQGIDFIYLNTRHSEYSFALHSQHQHQAIRRTAQYCLSSNACHALPLARLLICSKLRQTRRLLKTQPVSPEQISLTATLGQRLHSARHAADMATLRGVEGRAQRELFGYWRHQLPATLGFSGRARRPPPDPVNALLSLTYTLVYHEAIRQSLAHGLDPWLGFYHQLVHGRQSLACDLMEPLRPAVEGWVVERFCSGDFDLRHFSQRGAACLFGKAGRERYYALWYQQQPQWAKLIARHARWLARYLSLGALPATEEVA